MCNKYKEATAQHCTTYEEMLQKYPFIRGQSGVYTYVFYGGTPLYIQLIMIIT